MGSRLELQYLLEDLMDKLTGKKNVYFNPPPNNNMNYPAIKANLYKVDTAHANNKVYKATKCYNLIVIGKLPNDAIVDKLLELPMCSYDRHYTSDGLNHDVLQLYY